MVLERIRSQNQWGEDGDDKKESNHRIRSRCFITAILYPSRSVAFSPIPFGDGGTFEFYGFLRNNTGMFTETQPYAGSGNQLATERTWFRTNEDIMFNPQWRMGFVTQFVYEPSYPFENGANSSQGLTTRPIQPSGQEYSEYYNVNDILREAWVQWKPNDNTSFKVGRQIAQWGEALTTRITDVIQPNDNRFAFAFSNLEDTRIRSI